MLPQTSLRLATQYGTSTKRGTGRTDHDTTPNYPMVQGVGEPTLCLSSEEFEAALFTVIHDLIPTNDRLAKIQ